MEESALLNADGDTSVPHPPILPSASLAIAAVAGDSAIHQSPSRGRSNAREGSRSNSKSRTPPRASLPTPIGNTPGIDPAGTDTVDPLQKMIDMMLKQQQLQETLMRDQNHAMMNLVQALQSRQSMPPPQEPVARQQPGLKPEPIPDAINKLLAKETRDFKEKVLAYARVKDQVDKAKQDFEILSTSTRHSQWHSSIQVFGVIQ